MDRKANVKWIYAIGVALIITNAASGVGGDKPDNSPRISLEPDHPESDYDCCHALREICSPMCNVLKTSDYKYEHYFPISKKNDTVELKFKVKADRDVNLMFSTGMFVEDEQEAYEIVLGGTYNTKSIIRKLKASDADSTSIIKEDVLSPIEWREFWVKIKPDTVEVGRKNKNAFMELKNATNIPIYYYSIAGWRNANILWILPCIEYNFS
ncbi:uncharacterized protein LOC135839170 [Planococcus citri]|uniref:uncharacterized protein LOC135839170 n=1 Tax=Planococcus citri TaxID=170843 RepID=UPI0031FA3345